MTNLPPDELERAQTAVFVLIGKCILNLQLYEQALKNLLPHFDVSSNGPTPEQQREKLALQTLGVLIRQLLEKTAEFDEEPEEPKLLPGQTTAFRSRFRIPMNAEQAKQACDDLTDLLQKRNFLVHHFRSEFRLSTESGCLAAKAYLDNLNEQAKRVVTQINEIGNELKERRTLLASFLMSPEAIQLIDEMQQPLNPPSK
jgi:hypothetical protein